MFNMSDTVLVKSPNGKTEEHTPENAADLRRNAGWAIVGPKEDEVKDVKPQPKEEAPEKKPEAKKVEPKNDKKEEVKKASFKK